MPYEPPFELPDYKEVGRTLLALIHSYPIDDIPTYATSTEFTAAEYDDKFFAPGDLSLPHLGKLMYITSILILTSVGYNQMMIVRSRGPILHRSLGLR
jgi:hypothetical protein